MWRLNFSVVKLKKTSSNPRMLTPAIAWNSWIVRLKDGSLTRIGSVGVFWLWRQWWVCLVHPERWAKHLVELDDFSRQNHINLLRDPITRLLTEGTAAIWDYVRTANPMLNRIATLFKNILYKDAQFGSYYYPASNDSLIPLFDTLVGDNEKVVEVRFPFYQTLSLNYQKYAALVVDLDLDIPDDAVIFKAELFVLGKMVVVQLFLIISILL